MRKKIEKKWTAKDIERQLYHICMIKNHKFMINNIYLFRGWESDFISVTKADYIFEYEIKVTRSDYRNDFNKIDRHDSLENGECKPSSWDLRHGKLNQNGKVNKDRPNRFYFVCPEDLIKVDEIPDYAGLLYTTGYYYGNIAKQAPLLHKEKLIDKFRDKFFTALFYKYWQARFKLEEKK